MLPLLHDLLLLELTSKEECSVIFYIFVIPTNFSSPTKAPTWAHSAHRFVEDSHKWQHWLPELQSTRLTTKKLVAWEGRCISSAEPGHRRSLSTAFITVSIPVLHYVVPDSVSTHGRALIRSSVPCVESYLYYSSIILCSVLFFKCHCWVLFFSAMCWVL